MSSSHSSIVVRNSDLMLYVLSFMDPQYDEFYLALTTDLTCEYSSFKYYFVVLQTFRCLWDIKYIHNYTNVIKLKSLRVSYVISLSLFNWAVDNGVGNNSGEGSCSSDSVQASAPGLSPLASAKIVEFYEHGCSEPLPEIKKVGVIVIFI